MSGRFAGSKSLDDRRRRRIAAEETHAAPTAGKQSPSDPEKPLPTRRPSGRFPLRRIISRSPWKIAGIVLLALLANAAMLAAVHSKTIASGAYGPGLAAWCDVESGRATTTLGGLLLLLCGQLAWLIRWARSRSLRDFRGRYRIWWWASLALALGGVALLTDAHVAWAATVVWLTDQTPFGSDLLFRLAPAIVAVAVVLPALQGDMRNCRTSRTLILVAVLLWIAAGLSRCFPDQLAAGLQSLGRSIPTAAVTTGLFLLGVVTLFAALLFHARHVVYESVEPPDRPRRKKKVAPATAATPASEPKPKRTSRRAAKAKTEPKAADKTPDRNAAKPEPVAEAASKPPVESKTQPDRTPPAPKPAAASQPSPPAEDDWSVEDDQSNAKGRQHRLDEPHDPLKGLSKRERRKQRKLTRDRERAGL